MVIFTGFINGCYLCCYRPSKTFVIAIEKCDRYGSDAIVLSNVPMRRAKGNSVFWFCLLWTQKKSRVYLDRPENVAVVVFCNSDINIMVINCVKHACRQIPHNLFVVTVKNDFVPLISCLLLIY